MLTQEVSEVDRLLIISELEQVIQSLVTDQSINVEFDVYLPEVEYAINSTKINS